MLRWKKRDRYTTLILAALLAVAVCVGGVKAYAAEGTAAAMKLAKTQGDVNIKNSSERSLTPSENMRLYNGYQVGTEEEGYAWIELDSVKMAKLDTLSKAGIRKSGKKLEILLDSGNIFFNVAEPLKDDESLNIRTATMVAGIRGTSGWVEVLDEKTVKFSVLEGTVEVRVAGSATEDARVEVISGGETAVCVVSDQAQETGTYSIRRESFTSEDVSGFVLQEVVASAPLAEKIFEKGGIDLREVTQEDVETRIQEDAEALHRKVVEVEAARKDQETHAATEAVWVDTQLAAAPVPAPTPAPAQAPTVTPVPAPAPTITPEPEAVPAPEPALTPEPVITPEPSVKPVPTPEPSVKPTPTPEPSEPAIDPVTPATCRVTFDTQGGSSLDGQTVKYGERVGETSVPTREGYDFIGWYKDANCTQVYDFATAVTADVTLYAKWTEIVYHTVKYDFQFGGKVMNEAYKRGASAVEMQFDPNLRPGYRIVGWYTDAGGTQAYDFHTAVTADLTLYAKWERGGQTGNLQWSYREEEGLKTLTISGSGEMDNFDYDVAKPWQDLLGEIEAVRISNGVTHIGAKAFGNAAALQKVQMESVSSIGSYAFQACGSLTTVEFSGKLNNIESYAFDSCTGLKAVNLPDTLKIIKEYAFSSTVLESLTIPAGITEMGRSSFGNCNFGGRNVTFKGTAQYLNSITTDKGINPFYGNNPGTIEVTCEGESGGTVTVTFTQQP